MRMRMVARRRRHFVALLVVALTGGTASLATPLPVRADLGNCVTPVSMPQPHQGGWETALTSTSQGVFGIVTVRVPDLCNNLPAGMNNQSMSTGYVMARNDAGTGYHQVGYWRWPGAANPNCSTWYEQHKVVGQPMVTTGSAVCGTAGVSYRLRIRKLTDDLGTYWTTQVLRDTDGAQVFRAPDRASIGFTVERGEYSFEVVNDGRDQSGGGNSARARLAGLAYYSSTGAIVAASIPAADRFCDLCPTPYNSAWPTVSTLDVWTDGF